jgi:hypothetical protein
MSQDTSPEQYRVVVQPKFGISGLIHAIQPKSFVNLGLLDSGSMPATTGRDTYEVDVELLELPRDMALEGVKFWLSGNRCVEASVEATLALVEQHWVRVTLEEAIRRGQYVVCAGDVWHLDPFKPRALIVYQNDSSHLPCLSWLDVGRVLDRYRKIKAGQLIPAVRRK